MIPIFIFPSFLIQKKIGLPLGIVKDREPFLLGLAISLFSSA